ncbi:hypothetical protein [Bradyrhizobium sp. Ce-3]|uniref:hypothetical protein n=1 Tax=Bradyrhizobium sp. Ce-3 TaxID=2913970 RepID=UPI001FC88F11|nr:hypothetical protein [Bradyrhizobium sp. Ce-3]
MLVGDGEFSREQLLARTAAVAAAILAPSPFSALFITAKAEFIVEWAAEALKPTIAHSGAAPELLGPAQATAVLRFIRVSKHE